MMFGRAVARGFTLIEMAIVLVVIGLVVGGGLAAVGPVIQSTKVTETRAKLDTLEAALTLYAMQNSCLPCPAPVNTTDGIADWNGSGTGPCHASALACGTVRGVVPWGTLGLSRAEGSDAFATRITYEVTDDLTVTDSMERSGTTYTPLGELIVTRASGAGITTTAAYVLVSHGPNRHFGYHEDDTVGTQISGASGTSTVEDLNGDGNSTYIQDDFDSALDAGYFDDIVRWRSKPIIVQMCGDGACGNPS
jgi:prepilin-type N-terminal cleavage/methylation domain-containing protein